ncbi:hypothetical protein R9X47_25325 [Wukongibacter baidiensis]|uniref:hypothetical protein n=1 Tax=Wukongibacter baidiensis TaxID=1723361 RepID=UPI003D7F94B2
MKSTEFIGITKDSQNSIIGNLVFLLLKQNGFKVGLKNKRMIKIDEKSIKNGTREYVDVDKLVYKDMSLDYLILDDLKSKCIYEFTNKYTFDTVIDDGITHKEKENNQHDIEKKKTMIENLKRNGIVMINNDNDGIYNYFDSLRDKLVITYGLNARSTITASSLHVNGSISFNCSIQRGLTTSNGNEIEQMEFPIKIRQCDGFNISHFLSAIGVALIYEVPVVSIQTTMYELNRGSFK